MGGVLHDAQWVVDPVLARDLAAEVERCRLRIQPGAPPVAPPVAPPAAPPVAPPAAPPAAPAVVNPGLGPVGVAAHPVGSQVLAPAPPSQEADEEEAGDEAEDGDDDEDTGTNYDSRVVKVTGIPLREEIFEILEEVVDDLAGRSVEDDLEGIKTSLFDLRRVCAVSELLALVKTLIAISRSLQRRKLVETLLVM